MRVSSGSRSGDPVRSGLLAVVLAVLLLFSVDTRPVFAQADPGEVTFTRDVAPILFENCVSCHRPGEIGPMALTSYEEVRPWARVIRERVETRAMPPWHASPEYGEFANDRRLSDEAIRTVLAWVDAGAPRGDAADLPPMPTFPEGWLFGEPDVVITMPEPFIVPAEGVIDYQNILVPTGFTEDMYIVAAEVRPGDRGVVHHAGVKIHTPEGGRFLVNALGEQPDRSLGDSHRLVSYVPGGNGLELAPGVAMLVPAGSSFLFNMHYTVNGTVTPDQTSVGVIFARDPPKRVLRTRWAQTTTISIPPFEPNVEGRASFVFPYDVEIESLRPHLHQRGKDFRYVLHLPDGTEETLLWLPRWDFRWQTNYILAEPRFVPEGSRIEVIVHWDNSAENPDNPDPSAHVRYGEQSWDEMLAGYVQYMLVGEDLTRAAEGPSRADQ